MVEDPKKVWMRLECFHILEQDTRPNPRKVWPGPQMCVTCKKKKRVVEIHMPRIEGKNLTAPNAPKWYIKELKKGKR